mmetsp:Transcript_22451/g.36012  ORF Transcript_22451/g.36012 Transcript_22451/m.36012 type:complete len:297 (-) Transcript_22451:8-898(-)
MWFDRDDILYGLHNIAFHLWIKPDWRLIECLVLQVFTIITWSMSVGSLYAIMSYLRKYRQTECHWSVRYSIGVLSLSTLLSSASFLLLLFQQNGRYFDDKHILCRTASVLILISVVCLPWVVFASFRGYRKWKNIAAQLNSANQNIKWYEVRPVETEYFVDLKNLVAVKSKSALLTSDPAKAKEEIQETTLLNEATEEPIVSKDDIVFIAHKTRHGLHTLSFIGQLVLFAALQHKNYYEHQFRVYKWGERFSKLINEDDYFYAKWQLENGIKPDEDETFETLDWLEYLASTRHWKN